MVVLATALIFSIFLLIRNRKTMPAPSKRLLVAITAVCLLYVLFLVWLTIGFGSSVPPAAAPSP